MARRHTIILCLAFNRCSYDNRRTKKCTGVAGRAFPDGQVSRRNPVISDVIWQSKMNDVSQDTIDSFFPAPNGSWNHGWRRLLSMHLLAMDEYPIYRAAPTALDTYRFISLENPNSVVRIQRGDGHIFADCKRIDSIDDDGCGFTFAERRLDLPTRDWDSLTTKIDMATFWSLAMAEEPQGLDGYNYVVEGKVESRYNVVVRWCPKNGPFADICACFLAIHNQVWGVRQKTTWLSRLTSIAK